MKQKLLASIAVFVSWFLLDAVCHGFILASLQDSTPQVWRPRSEFKVGLIYSGVAISVVSFVLIYAKLISPKSLRRGIEYGVLYGLATGCAIGFGGYAVHPIPFALAAGWFFVAVIEALVGGAIVSAIVTEN